MPGTKISELPDGGSLQINDHFPVARGSFTRKIKGSVIIDKFTELDTKISQLSTDSLTIDNYELSAMPAYSVKSNPTNTPTTPIDVQANQIDTVLLRPSTGNVQFGKVTSGMFTGFLPISSGGTGATTSGTAINNLLPSQSGNTGKLLTTDGSNTSWVSPVMSSSDKTALTTLQSNSAFNVYDSPTIDLNWNASTRTLSAITKDGLIISDTPPSSPLNGQLWFDSSSGVTSVYYDSTWVDIGGGDSGTSAGSVNGIVKSDGAGNFSAAVAGTDYFPPNGFTLFYPPENSYTFTSTTFNNWIRIDFGTIPVGSPRPPIGARFAYCRLIGDTNSAQGLTMYSRSTAGGSGYVVSTGYDQSSDYVFLPIYNNGIDIYASGVSGTGWNVTAFGYLL